MEVAAPQFSRVPPVFMSPLMTRDGDSREANMTVLDPIILILLDGS